MCLLLVLELMLQLERSNGTVPGAVRGEVSRAVPAFVAHRSPVTAHRSSEGSEGSRLYQHIFASGIERKNSVSHEKTLTLPTHRRDAIEVHDLAVPRDQFQHARPGSGRVACLVPESVHVSRTATSLEIVM